VEGPSLFFVAAVFRRRCFFAAAVFFAAGMLSGLPPGLSQRVAAAVSAARGEHPCGG